MFKPLLFITFTLFIIGGVLFFYQDKTYFTKTQNSNISREKLIERLDTKALNQIKIQAEGSEVDLLQLQGGGWKVQSLNYDADIISIQDLLLNLAQIRLGELVTNNPDHHERFHLLAPPEKMDDWNENRHGFAISLLRGDGTPILSLLIGKDRANGPGQYVRQRGSNKVYLIPESLSVDSEANDWLNKDLLDLKPEQIQSVELQDGEKNNFSIKRDNAETDWKPSTVISNVPDSDKITTLLNRLGDLSYTKLNKMDYVSQESQDSALEEASLSVSLFNSKVYTLNLRKNAAPNGDYVLSLRMGISLEASDSADKEDPKLHKEMEIFNHRVNGRFFNISSWEGKELLLSD